MINIKELRIGNYIQHSEDSTLGCIDKFYGEEFFIENWHCGTTELKECEPIPLSEELLKKIGFYVINENSAGKRYGYVVNGIFNSDLTFTFWKTTDQSGKFFKGDLELKSMHQLQNLYFALTGEELLLC
jgi:hypothetical protein